MDKMIKLSLVTAVAIYGLKVSTKPLTLKKVIRQTKTLKRKKYSRS